jgi:hypothetical protein
VDEDEEEEAPEEANGGRRGGQLGGTVSGGLGDDEDEELDADYVKRVAREHARRKVRPGRAGRRGVVLAAYHQASQGLCWCLGWGAGLAASCMHGMLDEVHRAWHAWSKGCR